MRSWRSLICICCFSGSPFVSNLKQTHYLLRLLHLEFCNPRYLNSFFRIISQIQISFFWICHKQISNNLIVDLNIWHFDFKFLVCFILNPVKHRLYYEIHYSWIFIISSHSVGLTAACCTICKYTAIITLNHRFYQGFTCVPINCLSVCTLRKYSIKVISLFSWPMQNFRLFAFFIAF